MEFKDLVKVRRSCRSFERSLVSEKELTFILNAGQWAPSPLNLQPWEFLIITDPKIKAQVRQVAEDTRQEVIEKNGPSWVNKYNTTFLEEAPVLVVPVVDPSRAGLGDFFGQKYGAIQAVSACIQNMMLAATDVGLGSLWFTFFRAEKLRPILNIPDKLEVAGVIPIGKPKGPAKVPPRKEIRIHRERMTLSPDNLKS